MNELDALDLAELAARALGEPHCRRYLFDRPYGEEPSLEVGDAAASDRPAAPLPARRDAGSERRG